MSKTRIKLENILDTLGKNSDVTASGIVTRDGLMMASALPKKVDSDAISAMSAAMIALGTRVGTVLGQGDVEQVLIKSKKGYTLAVECGESAVLVALTDADAQLGMVFFELKNTVKEAIELL